MKILQTIIVLLYSATVFSNAPQTITKSVEEAVRKGHSKELAYYFNENIQLNIDNDNNFYSKKQAEKVLESFFKNNRPVKFSISNEKIKDNSIIVIGLLETNSYTYRVIYRFRKYNQKMLISYIDFEPL